MFLLSILILVYSLQALVLDFFLYDFIEGAAYAFVVIDGLLLIHLLINFASQNAAFKGAFQWLIYCWTLSIKLGIYYFQVFPRKTPQLTAEHLNEIVTLSASRGFFIIVFLTPLVYIFFAARASIQLFGSASGLVSVESLIFCDLGLHIMLDLLDIAIAFHYAADYGDMITGMEHLYKINGIFMITGLLFHSFALPTWSSVQVKEEDDLKKSPIVQQFQENDVFLTRKNAALVSMFLMDIPFLIVRSLWYVKVPNQTFPIYLLKNIINLPLSTYKLNQCRIAEKEHARATEKSSIHDTTGDSDTASVKSYQRASLTGDVSTTTTLAARKDVIIRELHAHWDSPIATKFARNDFDQGYATTSDEVARYSMRPPLPVRGISPSKVLRKIWHCCISGWKRSLSEKLDTCLMLSYWRQVRLGIAPVVMWVTRILLVGLFSSTTSSATRTEWDITIREAVIAYILCVTSAVLLFSQNVGSSGIIDVLFVSILWLFRNVSFFFTIWIIRDTHLFDLTQPFNYLGISFPSGINWEQLCIWGFACHPLLSFLCSLFYVQSTFLSRKYTHYVAQPRSRAARRLALPKEKEKFVRSDEFGWISTSSAIVYVNAKHHISPVGIHELLIGPDMIKATRLSDIMLTHDWYHLGLVMFIKALSFLLSHDYKILCCFVIHIVLEVVYIMLSQTVRLMSLRRFETKALYLDMIQAWYDKDPTMPLDADEETTLTEETESLQGEVMDQAAAREDISHVYMMTRNLKQDRLIDLANLLDKYRRHAFLTSPGETLPPLRV